MNADRQELNISELGASTNPLVAELLDTALKQSPTSETAQKNRDAFLKAVKENLGCFWGNRILERLLIELLEIETNGDFIRAFARTKEVVGRLRHVLAHSKGIIEPNDNPMGAIELRKDDESESEEAGGSDFLASEAQIAKLREQQREQVVDVLTVLLGALQLRYENIMSHATVTPEGSFPVKFSREEEGYIFGETTPIGETNVESGIWFGKRFSSANQRKVIEILEREESKTGIVTYKALIDEIYEMDWDPDDKVKLQSFFALIGGMRRKIGEDVFPYETVSGQGLRYTGSQVIAQTDDMEPQLDEDYLAQPLGSKALSAPKPARAPVQEEAPEPSEAKYNAGELEGLDPKQRGVVAFFIARKGTVVAFSNVGGAFADKPQAGQAMTRIKEMIPTINQSMTQARWNLELKQNGGGFILADK